MQRQGPHELLIEGIVFNYEDDVKEYRRRFIRARGMVNRSGAKDLGPKTSIPIEPYLLWYGGRTDLRFCVRIRTYAVEQESPQTFYFILKERLKKHIKNLLRCFVGPGSRLWKGKVLAPFSSMVIHGLFVTWFFRALALIFGCLKLVCVCVCVCVCVFWKCFWRDALF